jgi:hypothetical protein
VIHSIARVAAWLPGLAVACSSTYYLICLYSAARFLGEQKAAGGALPHTTITLKPASPVSILKPLKVLIEM